MLSFPPRCPDPLRNDWCIDQQGNQLPYIDRVLVTNVQDPEVLKLQYMEGQVDFVNGGFAPLTLADVSELRNAQQRSGLAVDLWDSGSGTGSIFFFNLDYPDEQLRAVIREPTFRQALSHAVNRSEISKTVYFNTGEPTTGTYSPKTIEFHIGTEGPEAYRSWRDSYVEYDPELAKRMLDELEVVDQDGDGFRELPDGSRLRVRLDFAAPGGQEHIQKNELLAQDWQAIGVNTELNPVPPSAYETQWNAGELMSKTDWECSGSMSFLISPLWMMPLEPTRWAPLHGNFFTVRGTPQESQELDTNPWERSPARIGPEDQEFFEPIERLWELYDQARVEPDATRRNELVWEMIKIHVEDGPFFMGTVASYPRIILAKEGLMNVPKHEDLPRGGWVNDWEYPTPAAYDPEAWYWDDPQAHS